VWGSISNVRSASSVGSFFFRRWSPTSFSPDSVARTAFQSFLQFSAARLHGFGIEAGDPGHFPHASPTEDRRNHGRNPSTMFLIQLIANQSEIRFPLLRLIRNGYYRVWHASILAPLVTRLAMQDNSTN
jgi:hypothetical protein